MGPHTKWRWGNNGTIGKGGRLCTRAPGRGENGALGGAGVGSAGSLHTALRGGISGAEVSCGVRQRGVEAFAHGPLMGARKEWGEKASYDAHGPRSEEGARASTA